jgi:AraC-like DNA-binding protein
VFYKSYRPSVVLQDFIEEYVIIYYDDNKDHLAKDKFIPRLGGALLFHFGGVPKLTQGSNTVEFPRVFITGQQDKFRIIEPGQDSDLLIARFKPTGIHNLFGISPLKICNNFVDATQIFGDEAHVLYKQIAIVKNVDDRIPLLESFLSKQYERSGKDKHSNLINDIIEKIDGSKGCIKIGELCRLFPIQERTLRRKFQFQTGVNVKTFSRLVKFNNIISELIQNPSLEMIDIVARFGYFDQTHFINDFKNIYGETPASFIKRDLVNTQYISAIK